MRRIKFRGLRHLDDGKTEWVYGFYVERWNNKRCICQYNPQEIPGRLNDYEDNWDIFVDVYEDSVGQFTGLKDRNGKDVYEGDILNNYDEPNPLIVKWDGGAARFALYTPEGDFECGFDALEVRLGVAVDAEIVGNIYKNTRHS